MSKMKFRFAVKNAVHVEDSMNLRTMCIDWEDVAREVKHYNNYGIDYVIEEYMDGPFWTKESWEQLGRGE
jgi:hypothetical protein